MEIDCKATEIEQLQSKLNETASLSSADNDPEDNQVSNQISKRSFSFFKYFPTNKTTTTNFVRITTTHFNLFALFSFFFFYFYISLATLKLQSSSSLTLHSILINYLFPMHPFTSSNQTYSSCISSGRQTKFIFRFNKKNHLNIKNNQFTDPVSVCVSKCFRIHLCFHLHRIRCLRAG